MIAWKNIIITLIVPLKLLIYKMYVHVIDNGPITCNSSVSELHLSMNGMTQVQIPDHTKYLSVTSLYINDNEINDWEDLTKIGRLFPNLEHLVMMKNPVAGIADDLMEDAVQSFLKLNSINISHILITSWEELERFRWFPSLTDVRLQGIPLWTVSIHKYYI